MICIQNPYFVLPLAPFLLFTGYTREVGAPTAPIGDPIV